MQVLLAFCVALTNPVVILLALSGLYLATLSDEDMNRMFPA